MFPWQQLFINLTLRLKFICGGAKTYLMHGGMKMLLSNLLHGM